METKPNEEFKQEAPELLPCPFIDHDAIVRSTVRSIVLNVHKLHGPIIDYWVQCEGCSSTGPREESELEAVEAWNSRASSPQVDAKEAFLKWFHSVEAATLMDAFCAGRQSVSPQGELISRAEAVRVLEDAAAIADPVGVIPEGDPEHARLASLRNTLKSAAKAIESLPATKEPAQPATTPSVEGWQPIETAPNSLVLTTDGKGVFIMEGHMREYHTRAGRRRLTHWMPLPAAPTSSSVPEWSVEHPDREREYWQKLSGSVGSEVTRECAGLAGCQVLEGSISEMFVHDPQCPKGRLS